MEVSSTENGGKRIGLIGWKMGWFWKGVIGGGGGGEVVESFQHGFLGSITCLVGERKWFSGEV